MVRVGQEVLRFEAINLDTSIIYATKGQFQNFPYQAIHIKIAKKTGIAIPCLIIFFSDLLLNRHQDFY